MSIKIFTEQTQTLQRYINVRMVFVFISYQQIHVVSDTLFSNVWLPIPFSYQIASQPQTGFSTSNLACKPSRKLLLLQAASKHLMMDLTKVKGELSRKNRMHMRRCNSIYNGRIHGDCCTYKSYNIPTNEQ